MGPFDERIMSTVDVADLQRAVEQFLFREARVVDANDYKTWVTMWAPECLYWVPSNDDESDPHKKIDTRFQACSLPIQIPALE